MRRTLALAAGLALLSPLAIGADGPSLASRVTTDRVQAFVDDMLQIPEVQQAFEEGDQVEVAVGSDVWWGTVASGAIVMADGSAPSRDHRLNVGESTMLSIANAYDPSNTAKLAVKAQYMTAESTSAAVRAAIGAIARTPLDERLPTYTPQEGDSITFGGCTGTLGPLEAGYFKVELCDDAYGVNEIGGITVKYPREHLTTPVKISIVLSLTVSLGPDEEIGESLRETLRQEFCIALALSGEDCAGIVLNLLRDTQGVGSS